MKMIVSGREIELHDFAGPLDQAFLDLYAAYFGGNAVDWPRFQTAAEAFFSTVPDRSHGKSHNDYFESFVKLWRPHIITGRFLEAEKVWEMALEPALNAEKQNGFEIHKGTPFYFWGATAILRGDLDKGFALMHQALEEDKFTVGSPGYADQPAYAFASLDFQKPDQAFKPWVDEHAKFLEGLVNSYASTHNRRFDLATFKTKFLATPPTPDNLFLFTYCLARLRHFHDLPDYIVKSDFASTLQVNILSELAVLLEDVLKRKNPNRYKAQKKPRQPPKECTFIDQAEFLLNKVNQPLAPRDLASVGDQIAKSLDTTLSSILKGSFRLSGGTALVGHQFDVAIAYGLRNVSVHNVFASSVIRQNFYELGSILFNILFAAADYI